MKTLKIGYWDHKNFHGSLDVAPWWFSTHLYYFDLGKRPLPRRLFLLFCITIGFVQVGDPLYVGKRFVFGVDALRRMPDGDELRIHLSMPISRKKKHRMGGGD